MALVILTALVYARSLAVPIYETDDYVYYFRDARLEHLSAESLWRIVTQPFFANFHPLTTLTYAFDRAVWGTWVPGFHITQHVLYAAGVLGLYFLFARVLEWRAGAFVAAALYAAHAVHVESVAWLASRKDVVCLLFYALALLAYVRYANSPEGRGRWGPYALSLVMAAAAMMSKGYAVVLPAAMLAYDLCFSGRITRRRLLDKVPFLLLTAAAVLLTVNAQDRDSALIQPEMAGERRVGLLLKVLALYAGRSILPVNLSAFYTIANDPVGPIALTGALLAVALVVGFFYLRRRVPAAAFGIALFLLPLGTVMNVLFTLRIWMADRYLFFPTIGSCLALVALAGALYHPRRRASADARLRSIRAALGALAVIGTVLYSYLTIARTELWTSRVNLWSDVLRKELHLAGSGGLTAAELSRITNLSSVPTSPVISLVRAYESAGNNEEAERISALVGNKAGGEVESEMARARQDLDEGRIEEAMRRLTPIAAGRTWMAPMATIWIGVAEDRMGNAEASNQTLRRGIELYRKTGQPATDALISIGAMEFSKGDYAKAAEWYRLARQESPHEAKAAFSLGRALEEGGNLEEAMQLYKQIASGEPPILAGAGFTIFDVYLQMAVVAEKQGHLEEAIRHCEEALRSDPEHPKRQVVVAAITTLRGRIAR